MTPTSEISNEELIEKCEKALTIEGQTELSVLCETMLTRFKSLTENRSELVEKSAEEILKEALGEMRYNLSGSVTNSQIIWAMKEYANQFTRHESAKTGVEEIITAVCKSASIETIFPDRTILDGVNLTELRTALQKLLEK